MNAASPEGLPTGMVKEFEDSMRTALLVRQSFLDLRDNFRRVVDPPMWPSNGKGVDLMQFLCTSFHFSVSFFFSSLIMPW